MATTTNNAITPAQRAALFGMATRQHYQMVGSQTVSGGAQTIQFNIPKARLLAQVNIGVSAKVKITGTAKTFSDSLAPYKLLRKISLDFNNGFSPFTISGENLARLSMLRNRPEMVLSNTASSLCTCEPLTAATGGKDVNMDYLMELPLTLNRRDPTGLILAQNAESNITCSIDLANGAEIIGSPAGYTVEISTCKITCMTTTFSIPSSPDAFPDLSVIKLVQSRTETFPGGGSNTIRIPTGVIYRKLMVYLVDGDGNALTPDKINGNLELIFNTADVPYSVSPEMLRYINASQLGYYLPDGVYAFDFSDAGFTNYGGARDYVDTEKITSFELRFASGDSGTCNIISETLSRLIQSN